MNTVLSNTRNANLQIITALAIMIVVFLAFAVVPSISVPQPAAISETSSRTAYVEFLSGEKVMFGNPARLSEALAAYLAGEKATFANAVDAGNALSAYHLGEKAISANAVEWNSALPSYRLGEKAIYTDTIENALPIWSSGEKAIFTNSVDAGNALSVWSFGEKGMVRFDVLESALLTYRQGEKEIR